MAIADLAYQHAMDRFKAVGFDNLSEQERDFVTLWQVEARVNNGGFAKYYSGVEGDQAYYAPQALARVGAAGKAALVREANALFGPAGPPRDRAQRTAALKALSPSALATIDELERRYYDDPADVDELVERIVNERA